MIQEILPEVYLMEVPLPGSPLKALNSYLIKSPGRSLVIDTGMNREECRQKMRANLAELEVELEETDFFITHLHADHVGLAACFPSTQSRVYMGAIDAHILNNELGESRWRYLFNIFIMHGLPEKEAESAIQVLPGRLYGPQSGIDVIPLSNGAKLDFGDYSFTCIQTSGHTPGHLCLYEETNEILFCGDLILDKITPNIAFWPEMQDSLAEYLASLDKIDNLDIRLMLPGHRAIFDDNRRRIAELREHHQSRLNEILISLNGEEKTAYQIAPDVSWDIGYESWEEFPALQKWFAMGEIIAHLLYLQARGAIQSRMDAGRILFSRWSDHMIHGVIRDPREGVSGS